MFEQLPQPLQHNAGLPQLWRLLWQPELFQGHGEGHEGEGAEQHIELHSGLFNSSKKFTLLQMNIFSVQMWTEHIFAYRHCYKCKFHSPEKVKIMCSKICFACRANITFQELICEYLQIFVSTFYTFITWLVKLFGLFINVPVYIKELSAENTLGQKLESYLIRGSQHFFV